MRPAIEDRGDRAELVAVEGEKLSAVTFVQDYVQLHFDGPRLTLIAWPVVRVGDASHAVDDPGYRDQLCRLIGRVVVRAYVRPGDRLQIDFVEGLSLMASLDAQEYRAAHVVIFDDGQSKQWAAW
jgi:hypothetical protein